MCLFSSAKPIPKYLEWSLRRLHRLCHPHVRWTRGIHCRLRNAEGPNAAGTTLPFNRHTQSIAGDSLGISHCSGYGSREDVRGEEELWSASGLHRGREPSFTKGKKLFVRIWNLVALLGTTFYVIMS